MPGKQLKSTDVLLYYPNIVGYLRFFFMMASFFFALSSWRVSIFCYLVAFVGDVLDGYVARKFNQCTYIRSAVISPLILNGVFLLQLSMIIIARLKIWRNIRYGD